MLYIYYWLGRLILQFFLLILTAVWFFCVMGYAKHENCKKKIIKKCLGAGKWRWKCIFAPKKWIFSQFFYKYSTTLNLTAIVFLKVWGTLNKKIMKKNFSKFFKGGSSDDENAKKRLRSEVFHIFLPMNVSLRFWRRWRFFMIWGMVNQKITTTKISKIVKGG